MTTNGTASQSKPEISSSQCFHCQKETQHPLSSTRVVEIFCSMKCRQEAYSEIQAPPFSPEEELSPPTPI